MTTASKEDVVGTIGMMAISFLIGGLAGASIKGCTRDSIFESRCVNVALEYDEDGLARTPPKKIEGCEAVGTTIR